MTENIETKNIFRGILLLVSCFFLVAQPGRALAVYTAEALSEHNSMRGGSIEIDVEPNTAESPVAQEKKASYAGSVRNKGTNAFRYRIKIAADGDTDFCKEFHVQAERQGTSVYSGLVSEFVYTAPDPLAKDGEENWKFFLSAPQGVPADKNIRDCFGIFRLEAWQGELTSPDRGWTDEARLTDEATPSVSQAASASPETTSVENTDEGTSPETPGETPNEIIPPVSDETITPDDGSSESSVTDTPKANSEVKSDETGDTKKDEEKNDTETKNSNDSSTGENTSETASGE